MSRPLKKPAAYVCNRCGYVESYIPLKDLDVVTDEAVAARHCGVAMRLVSKAELRKIDAEAGR